MRLSEAEKDEIKALIDRGEPLPDKYRFSLFREPREAELIWPGKTHEVTSVVLPFQSIEQIDEPRAEGVAQDDLFQMDRATGRQSGGWTNKLIWGDNKLVLSSLKNGPLRTQIEDAGGLKLVYIDPPFDVGADFSREIELESGDFVTKEPSLIEQVAFHDTWGRGRDSYAQMIFERLSHIKALMQRQSVIFVHVGRNVSHVVRSVADSVFRKENFVNELTWKRSHAHGDTGQGATHFGRVTEAILVYSNGAWFQWTPQYILNIQMTYLKETTSTWMR